MAERRKARRRIQDTVSNSSSGPSREARGARLPQLTERRPQRQRLARYEIPPVESARVVFCLEGSAPAYLEEEVEKEEK